MSADLSDHHRAALARESSIKPEVITARGYRTVTAKADLAKLGFSRSQQLVPALLIPIHDPTGRVATYQIRPDEPREVKGKKLKYETPTGSSLTLDVNPLSLNKLGDPATPLCITEGSKKVDALASRGLCALGLMGVWGWRGTNPNGGKTALPAWENVALNGRTVYLCFDSDVTTKREVYAALERLKAFLESRDAKVKIVYLPDDGDAKTGVDDYLAKGHDIDDLLKLASDELKPPPDDGVKRAGPYLIRDGAIYHERSSRDGKVPVALCNFSARIVSQNERDDGVEKNLTLVLEGTLYGQPLPPAEVTAAQFGAMNWPVERWGTQAVVYAGMGAKDHLRTALQLFSGNVPRQTTYTHLGWRKVGDQHVYLHAGGTIAPVAPNAPQTIQVDAPESLRGYILPDPPGGDALKKAVRASLKTLDLAPDRITVPLLAAIYRAPLGNVDFALHLAGSTGAGKSELSAVTQQHYGPGLDSRNLPGSWSSTANALEGLAFSAKDALVVVDDFAPEGSSIDIQRYHATAARLFRAQGNGAGRGRMRADGTLRPDKPPRGLILSTGEDIPKGHSIRARTVILELEPGDLDWRLLTEAQSEAANGIYASALSSFIRWIAADYENRTAAFVFNHAKHRNALRIGGHRRTLDAGAQLLAALESLLSFAVDVGALNESERGELWQRFEVGIIAALEPQAALQSQADPVARFSELLTGIFSSQRAHLEDAARGGYPGDGWGWKTEPFQTQYGTDAKTVAKGARLGWIDSDVLYLEPGSLYAALQSFAREQGEAFPLTERTLLKRLSERGLIQAADAGRATLKKSFPEAGRLRVVCIPVSTLQISGAIGAGGAEAVRDGIKPCPDNENAETLAGQSGQQDVGEAPCPDNLRGSTDNRGSEKRQETASETAPAPVAPIAPQKLTLETPVKNVQTTGTPPEVLELHQRFLSGDYKNRQLTLDSTVIPDLERHLEPLFRTRPDETGRAALIDIAAAVGISARLLDVN